MRESLDPEANRKMVFKAGESQGKSGSFFFFSKDQRFIIKTMTDDDFDAWCRIQKHYFKHVQTNENSLLARVYGVYSIRMEDQKPVKLVVMENGIRGAKREDILGIFDLKGSMVNRLVKGSDIKPTATVKDQNLLAKNKKQIWLRFRDIDRRRILSVMARDVSLLKEYNLMDYSLLLCIQENPEYMLARNNRDTNSSMAFSSRRSVDSSTRLQIREKFEGSRHKFLSTCGRYIYHIGLIDYLQDFNFDKKGENLLKQRILGKGEGISAVHPRKYADRFVRFMRDHVIID